MGKRAPALGRKVKPGKITHVSRVPSPFPGDVIYGTYVTPTESFKLIQRYEESSSFRSPHEKSKWYSDKD